MNKKEVYIVTGATGGMGKVLAQTLYSYGFPVIMACRNTKAAGQIIQATDVQPGNPLPVAMELDLASFRSVSRFAKDLQKQGIRIKALIHNAGTLNQQLLLTEDGLEQMTQVNYVSPYLLTRLLLPLMSGGSRIVCTSSCTCYLGNIQQDFFSRGIDHFHMFRTYGSSKLAVLAFATELSHHCQPLGITVNTSDPGIVDTGMITMHRWFDPLTDLFFRPFIKSPQEGAATTLYLSCSEETEHQTGKFWKNKHPRKIPSVATDRRQCRALWEATEAKIAGYLTIPPHGQVR